MLTRRSGRTLSEAERVAAGRERMTARPHAGTRQALGALAERWGCSRTDALERAVREALAAPTPPPVPRAHGTSPPHDDGDGGAPHSS